MKKLLFIILVFTFSFCYCQNDDQRISNIKHQLELLSGDNPGLSENVKTQINVNSITLDNFLIAISNLHKININVSPELNNISIKNNFSNVSVSDLLVFLCKEYHLTIDFSGNILSVKQFIEEEKGPRIVPIIYSPNDQIISIDVEGDKLYDVFKQIMDKSGKNLVFSSGLESKQLTAYIQNMPFDAAMDKMAIANNLYFEKTKDGFYLFDNNIAVANNTANNQNYNKPARRRNSNFFFEVKNPKTKLLKVDFENVSIADIIHDIGDKLNLNIFVATPLDGAGFATFKAKAITFDNLLVKLFESQIEKNGNSNSGTTQSSNQSQVTESSDNFTFKKEANIYYFGTEKQLSVRQVEIISLKYRSIEMVSDMTGGNISNRNNTGSTNNNNNQNTGYNNNRPQPNQNNNRSRNQRQDNQEKSSILDLIPKELHESLEITVDPELNSFYIVGPNADINRFKSFVNRIDKPVPVVLIEVMIIEVSKSSIVETGVSWGIGDSPVQTAGAIFPETNLTLGAQTINKIIGGFDGFGSFNMGKVVPNFFATIKAMESNGDLKIRSTPKLATLNGHRATFSNGQTSYYGVTERNYYGTDNPQTSEYTNYYPIDVELGLSIKPSVTEDGQVILEIDVIQSSFGQRIAENAPPDINFRNFNSVLRMKDKDMAVLGGLEENYTNNSGSGVPLLARIPVIKWLFSKRKREGKKSKLTVLIKPTIIN